MTASARTHAGRVRSHNEDAAVCRPEHGLFAVIDGMGGQEAGEVAAAIAAAALAEVPHLPNLASETVLAAAMKEARSRILREAEANPSQKDMGAVATAVRLDDNGRGIGVAHVGDTRAWLVNGKGVRQLTHDHVATKDGTSGKQPVARDLGRRTMEGEWVETGHYPVARGDLLVLASDGLHDALPAEELAAELSRLWREGGDADGVSARLVALALARGGPDNVTVVAVRIDRFRRGHRRRRLGLSLTVGLFIVLATLAGLALFGRHPPAGATVQIPDRVSGAQIVTALNGVTIEAGKVTTVDPGARLDVRGARIQGADWTIDVGEGATFTLDLAAVDLTGGFTVKMAKGATVRITDSGVYAGGVAFTSVAPDVIRLDHVRLRVPGHEAPTFVGPAVVEGDYAAESGAIGLPPGSEVPTAPEKGAEPVPVVPEEGAAPENGGTLTPPQKGATPAPAGPQKGAAAPQKGTAAPQKGTAAPAEKKPAPKPKVHTP